MIAIPIWAKMLVGALLGFLGFGLAVRARPGPRQKFFFIGGGLMALVGAYLLFSNFL
jgi:hypothetical protein